MYDKFIFPGFFLPQTTTESPWGKNAKTYRILSLKNLVYTLFCYHFLALGNVIIIKKYSMLYLFFSSFFTTEADLREAQANVETAIIPDCSK